LHKGYWNGNKFNESWIKYTTTPPRSEGDMEAFWLNAGGHFQMYQEIYHCGFFSNGGK
jgi:hypothetical protein